MGRNTIKKWRGTKRGEDGKYDEWTSKYDEEVFKLAVAELKGGGVVAFPTETVYGLGAVAFLPDAVRKIFRLKGRPSDNPLIVHIADINSLYDVAESVPDSAVRLALSFWPGPLTLVLRKGKMIPPEVTAGLDTVAVRMPAHPVALRLIKEVGPIAAPSANPSGKPSPTSAQHVKKYFGDKIIVLDGGRTKIGIESTVLDLTSSPPQILRPGIITPEEISEVLDEKVVYTEQKSKTEKPKSPGMKYKHYAPNSRLVLVIRREKIKDVLEEELKGGEKKKVLLVLYREKGDFRSSEQVDVIISGKNVMEVSFNLFDILISAEEYSCVVFEGVEEKGMGIAVMDRLRKAADKIIE